MQRSSLNKHNPLPGIQSPTQDPKPAAAIESTKLDDQCDKIATTGVTSEIAAPNAAESKPTAVAGTGPTTNAYKRLRDLPLQQVVDEVESRMNRLKSFDKFSNSDCSDDLLYLNAATRCGSNPEVNCVQDSIMGNQTDHKHVLASKLPQKGLIAKQATEND